MQSIGKVVYDEQDKSKKITGSFLDITERKQAEDKIKENEADLNLAQKVANLGSWKFDVKTQIPDWSNQMYQIFGINPENGPLDYIGHKNIIHQQDWEEFDNAVQLTVNTGVGYKISIRINRPNGEIGWIITQCDTIKDKEGNVIELFGICQDITARKQSEMALLESEQKFKDLTTLLPLIVYEHDINLKLTFANKQATESLGYSQYDFENNFDVFQIFIPEERERAKESLRKVLEGENPGDLESTALRKDGSTFSILISSNIIRKDNKTVGIRGVIINISEIKQAEEKIKKAHNQLEELYRHQDEIKENERKAISREIHDELGQSLTALKIDLYYTKDNIEKNAVIEEKISGMIDIVSDTIKRVQRISSELRPSLLDDLGLVPAIEWYVQEFEKRTNIQCMLDLEEVEFADQNKNLALYRIVQEAFTNIIRHANAKNVGTNFYRKNDNVILEIIDDGIGIKAEKIRSSKSLGLIGITERVKQYNGSFDIRSELNKGTKISVVIPFDGETANKTDIN